VSLYDQIGPERLLRILTIFYEQAQRDGIIGHFFFDKDHTQLVERQMAFTARLLGGPDLYQGKPIAAVHQPLAVRKPHFMRRQIMMSEVARLEGVDETTIQKWLALESQLQPLVLSQGKKLT
jgi:hemoglobin